MSIVFVYTQLNVKMFLFQTIQFSLSTVSIQFSISMQFSCFWPIDRNPSSATTLDQSGPGSDDNDGKLYIPQSFSSAGTSPSDCLVSYQDTHWGSGLTTQ